MQWCRWVGGLWNGDAAAYRRGLLVRRAPCRRPRRTVCWRAWSGRWACWRGREAGARPGAGCGTGRRVLARAPAAGGSSSPSPRTSSGTRYLYTRHTCINHTAGTEHLWPDLRNILWQLNVFFRLVKRLYRHDINHSQTFLPWHFDIYQRPSSEEVVWQWSVSCLTVISNQTKTAKLSVFLLLFLFKTSLRYSLENS